MSQNALIQVRVEEAVKKEADHLFQDLGMDTPTAIRIFLKQAIKQQGLPFAVVQPQPNAETLAALADAEAGRNLSGPFVNPQELMSSLLEDHDG